MSKPTIQFEEVLGSAMIDKRVEVLRAIHRLGSISEAARANGVSYKAAWQAVETLGNLAGMPLIEKVVGGSGGGGAKLTAAGLRVLNAADVLRAARHSAILGLTGARKKGAASLLPAYGLGLRTSMRNQFPCRVREIKKSQSAARVELELDDGQSIFSRVTAESLELLELKKGQRVLALCKAAAVKIAPKIIAIGGINLLRGKISRRSKINAEQQLTLELMPGLQIVGFADPGDLLKLKQPAMAALDESAVVIGLAG